MPRTYLYVRAQTKEASIAAVEAAGFVMTQEAVFIERIEGPSAADDRRVFCDLLRKLGKDDVLVVTQLDALGRSIAEVQQTIGRLRTSGTRLYCTALGHVALTRPEGQQIVRVIAAIARFERDLLTAKIRAGQRRAYVEGKKVGRPPSLSEDQQAEVLALLNRGGSVSSLARAYKTTRQTIMRIRERSVWDASERAQHRDTGDD